jgi:hypothetical protein
MMALVGFIGLILGLGIVDHVGNSMIKYHQDGGGQDGYVGHTAKTMGGTLLVFFG